MRVFLVACSLLALQACSKDPPATQDRAGGNPRVDAAPKHHGLALITAAADFTHEVGGGPIVVIAADGSLRMRAPTNAERDDGDDVPVAGLNGDPVELTDLKSKADAIRAANYDALAATPPPPEPEEEPPLGEGKMGKKEPAPRGQYYFKRDPDDPCFQAQLEEQLAHGDNIVEPLAQPVGVHGAVPKLDRCAGYPLLILADAGGDAARLIEVMLAMRLSQLGVTVDGGVHARPLQMAFSSGGDGTVEPADVELVFALRPDGVEATATGGSKPWTWTGEAKDLSDAYRQGHAVDGMLDARVRVRIDGKVTAGVLITALVKLAEGNLDRLLIGG